MHVHHTQNPEHKFDQISSDLHEQEKFARPHARQQKNAFDQQRFRKQVALANQNRAIEPSALAHLLSVILQFFPTDTTSGLAQFFLLQSRF
jgi:hypothetical protein